LLALAGVAKRGWWLILDSVELLGQLFLVVIQASRLVAHVGHFLGKPVRRLFAQLFAEVV